MHHHEASDGIVVCAADHRFAGKRPVEAMVFDIRGVLFDDSAWHRWLLRLLGRMGLHTQYAPFFRLWERDHVPRVNAGRQTYWEAMRCFLREAGLSRGQLAEVEAAGRARQRSLADHVFAFPGVVATLRQLHGRGVALAAYCNTPWTAGEAMERLERLHLASYFQSIVCDRQLARVVPSPEPVCAATASMKIPRHSICYVGRDPCRLREAAAAGFRCVAFNHELDARAEICLDRFPQLLELVPARAVRAMAG